jgi:hypothetical protein
MAERHVVEHSGRGVICFISNYSWLDGLSFTGMRERYLEKFDRIWIDCLNGDKYKTGKLTPEGLPDPSAFSTDFNAEGIQVGTAIALMTRKASSPRPLAGEGSGVRASFLYFRHWWGKGKREALLASLEPSPESHYALLQPSLELGLPFMPMQVQAHYLAWPRLPELLPASFPGVKTSRDDALVDIDRAALEQRMRRYFDPAVSDEEMRRIAPALMEKTSGFDPKATRITLQQRGFRPENIVRYAYRPFDTRWLYWEPETKLLDRNRSDYFPHLFPKNIWLEARQRQSMDKFDRGFITRVLGDNFGNGLSSFFPLYLKPFPNKNDYQPNLSPTTADYLAGLDADAPTLFHHIIAILHAPAYRADNAGALKQDWPRIPLPATREQLLASAELGRQIAALLDTETPLPGVTQGKPRPELAKIALLTILDNAPLTPAHLQLTTGWGHAGKGGVTMPGKGKTVSRPLTTEEQPGFSEETLDVYLNAVCYWKNIPRPVWEFTIGGYQVIKKWLSYRELELLERPLSADEALELTWIARRITALVSVRPILDKNYQGCVNKTANKRQNDPHEF